MARSGVRIAIGSDFDHKGFLAAEKRSARFAEEQLAKSAEIGSGWVRSGQGIMTFGQKVTDAGRTTQDVGASMTRNITLPLVAVGGASIKASIDFESAFAGVRKTVDATEPELAALRQGIRDMAMELPASREEIAGVAEAAGQLGIQTPNILGFTRVMTDLGESTNLSASDAATQLARLANITQMSQDDFDKLGSSIVDLGNNFATTEAEIVEMAMRIAGSGTQIGLTEPQILALATALSSVGIEAEAGGTAISQTMSQIDKTVAKASIGAEEYAASMGISLKKAKAELADNSFVLNTWAETAGMSASKFAEVWEKDAVGALEAVFRGMGNVKDEGGNLNLVLEQLEIDGLRQGDTMKRVSGAADLLSDSISTSSDAWDENTALTKEASQRYETTASRLLILKNRATDVGVSLGDSLAPAMMDALDASQPLLDTITDMADRFAALDPEMQRSIIKWTAVAAVAGPVLSAIGSMTIGIGTLINVVGQSVVTIGKLKNALVGLKIASLLTNPVGLAALAVGGLGVALYAASRAAKDGEGGMKAYRDSLDSVAAAAKNAEQAQEDLVTAQDNLTQAELNQRAARREWLEAEKEYARVMADKKATQAEMEIAHDRVVQAELRLKQAINGTTKAQQEAATQAATTTAAQKAAEKATSEHTFAMRSQFDSIIRVRDASLHQKRSIDDVARSMDLSEDFIRSLMSELTGLSTSWWKAADAATAYGRQAAVAARIKVGTTGGAKQQTDRFIPWTPNAKGGVYPGNSPVLGLLGEASWGDVVVPMNPSDPNAFNLLAKAAQGLGLGSGGSSPASPRGGFGGMQVSVAPGAVVVQLPEGATADTAYRLGEAAGRGLIAEIADAYRRV